MESNSLRFSSILSNLNMNVQDDLIRKNNPLSLSNINRNSPSSGKNSENKEVIGDINDQENKPPVVESISSSAEGIIFKKPLPRATMPNDECTLNSVIDELNHLKLGSTPAKSKRFNFYKWTTPLKRKAPQSDDSCASFECSTFDKKPQSPPSEEKTVDDWSSNKADRGSRTNPNEDPDTGSDYYDCGEEEHNAHDQARSSEMSSDLCNTADSSFHSVPEKEQVDGSASGNIAIVKTDSELICEANLAEINRIQDNNQAFILEKYLTEQDFKLEISLGEMSFNSAIDNIDIESYKRESICIQTENTVSGSLFSFEHDKKSEQQNSNDVTIQLHQLSNVCSLAHENEPQTEDSLFNLITDYIVQNETQTSFDLDREENMFTFSRISEAAFLHINTIEEEDALIQQPARKSLQLQSSSVASNQNNANESKIKGSQVLIVPVSEETEVNAEIVNENSEFDVETSINEISSNLSRVSTSARHTYFDQFSTDDAEKAADKSNSSLVETNETISVIPTQGLDENNVENNNISAVAKLNETADLELITTTNETSSDRADLAGKSSRLSSPTTVIRTESAQSCSLFDNTAITAERDFKQNIELSTFNRTVDLEASQQFSLEIEDENLSKGNSNETIHLKTTQTFINASTLKLNETVDLEISQHSSLEIEDGNLNKTVDLEETRTFNNGGTLVSHETVVLEASQHFDLEIDDENLNKTVNLEETRTFYEGDASNASQTVNLEASLHFSLEFDDKNSNKTANLEETRTSDDSDTLETNQSVDLVSVETTSAEVVLGNSNGVRPDQLILNQTSSATLELSLQRKTFLEPVIVETSPAVVENLVEQCQMTNANQTVNLNIVEVVNENKSGNDELDEPDYLDTISTIDETPAESLASNERVAFNLNITRVIGEEIEKNDESTIEQTSVFLETSQSDFLESTCLVEKGTDTIAESDNLNRTFDANVEKPFNDSSVPVESSLEQTNAVHSGDVRVIDDKISDISDSLRKLVDSELETVKNNELEEPKQPLDLSPKVETDSTLQIADIDTQNETVNLDNPTAIESEPYASLQEPSKLNGTIILHEDITQVIPHSLKPVGSTRGTDIFMEIEEMTSCCDDIVTDIDLESADTKINVMPTSNIESIFKNSPGRFEIADDYSTSAIKSENLNVFETKQFEDTVMIQGSPCPRRSDSPCQFDIQAIPSNEPASPIPPTSPAELSNKWRTQVDLSSVADNLKCITGRDSPSNSGDELDITDPVDSNLPPEIIPIGKLPPGINRSYSNLASIPEMNEMDESNLSEEDVKKNITVEKSLKNNVENAESKPETFSNQTTTHISVEELPSKDVSSSTQTPTSSEMQSKRETGLDKSIIASASLNATDLMFKTPIAKLSQQSDLSALHDSSFNADYCCARNASTKASQSFKQYLISPKNSFLKGSPISSPFCTPNRRMKEATPKASGDILPSLLDMSIGYFVKCPATQVEQNETPQADTNKTIDVDEDQPMQHEETKLLYLDEPSRKVNVKTQTHDTELSDLRAENVKLREDLNALMELTQAMADNEVETRKTIQTMAHNEAELKEIVRILEDNNRILNNKYELLTEYSNELLARRNKELDEADEKIEALQIRMNEFSKKFKTEASSK